MKKLQSALQWLFMRAEALFNAAFGDRVNPLYHLGEISFFLFWVVAASGLYLYAFFETGVTEAYDSVQALTHGQWYAGGVLRSVHRYASDAMVATMLVHMLRHFAFDRLHGLRWFSWITGVVLVWLMYACGINGYMLPWDQLAQYVVIASFEWLDWLPSFGGTLMRNFIHRASVSDRFFSLLSFIHIGLPLATLLLMWVHVQRVPKAHTNPPRRIGVSVVVTMLVLAAAVPVVSQGGAADLGSAPTNLRLDWFYLPLFPLITDWPLGRVWALVGVGTAVLVLLPWWPPRWPRARGAQAQATVRVRGAADARFSLRAGETLLEGGLRSGVALPYECRNGGCGVCACHVLRGQIEHRPYQRSALSDADRDRGMALLCCAVPVGDVEIELLGSQLVLVGELQRHVGRVVQMHHLAPEVMQVRVALPEGVRMAFVAGQYINIVLDDGQRRAFSFANPPHDNALIELHVRRIPGGRFTGHVFEGMKVGDPIEFEGPLGSFTLHESERPILFVAGATGFAPIKSIVEDAFHRGIRRPMRLYWGVRRPQDFYLLELAQRWEREHPNFTVIPVLSEPRPEDGWMGRTGFVHQAMLEDLPDLAGYEVYLCGSVQMADSAAPLLATHGLDEGACFSDAFTPAARAPASA